jgi:hypothetical protein
VVEFVQVIVGAKGAAWSCQDNRRVASITSGEHRIAGLSGGLTLSVISEFRQGFSECNHGDILYK